MKKQFYSVLAAAALTGTLAAPVLAQNLAIVNGKAIPSARLDVMAQQMARTGQPVSAEQMGQLRERAIADEVLAQEAQRQGLDATADYKNQLELIKQAVLIDALLNKFKDEHPATDAEIQAEYDRIATMTSNAGKQYLVRHILVTKEDEAKAIIAALKKGAKFEALAKKQSKDTGSAVRGGLLDWANEGNYVQPFSEAMVKLAKGKFTETPVKSEFGYHVIRLDDVREAPKLPALSEVKPQIGEQISRQKMRQFYEELRAKAKVE